MGLFYTNITLFEANRTKVVEQVAGKRNAYVSPTVDGFTVIYDKHTEDQDPEIIKELTSSLSKNLVCNALAVLVHDSDIFVYWLYNHGKLLDYYNSVPSYFEDTEEPSSPTGGDAKKLCSAFGIHDAINRVNQIFQTAERSTLNMDTDDFLAGEDIHRELAQALNIPIFAVETGYYTIDNGELSDEFEIEQFIKYSND
jgi:hypothetical protein